jgi:hypothetical protein
MRVSLMMIVSSKVDDYRMVEIDIFNTCLTLSFKLFDSTKYDISNVSRFRAIADIAVRWKLCLECEVVGYVIIGMLVHRIR